MGGQLVQHQRSGASEVDESVLEVPFGVVVPGILAIPLGDFKVMLERLVLVIEIVESAFREFADSCWAALVLISAAVWGAHGRRTLGYQSRCAARVRGCVTCHRDSWHFALLFAYGTKEYSSTEMPTRGRRDVHLL